MSQLAWTRVRRARSNDREHLGGHCPEQEAQKSQLHVTWPCPSQFRCIGSFVHGFIQQVFIESLALGDEGNTNKHDLVLAPKKSRTALEQTH